MATPTLTHLDWGPLACLLGGFLYSSNPGLLGYSDPKPLESGYYKHVFETEFVGASTSENASGMSHRYPVVTAPIASGVRNLSWFLEGFLAGAALDPHCSG